MTTLQKKLHELLKKNTKANIVTSNKNIENELKINTTKTRKLIMGLKQKIKKEEHIITIYKRGYLILKNGQSLASNRELYVLCK